MPADRRRHRPHPVAAGNLTIPAHTTVPLGWCLDCRATIHLAFNGDTMEAIVAHADPWCRAWSHRGTIALAKSTPDGPVLAAGSGPTVAP